MTRDNLARLLFEAAEWHPDRDAVVSAGSRLAYGDVARNASAVSSLLRERGIGRGDTVAVSCPNVPDFPSVYFGVLAAGATVVPLNVLLKAREVSYHLRDSGAKAFFCYQDTPGLSTGSEGLRGFHDAPDCRDLFVITSDPEAESPFAGAQTLAGATRGRATQLNVVDTHEDDTAVILYTSGTTGYPKGAELRHRNLRDNAMLSHSVFGSDRARPDRYLCVLPLFHSFGQTCVQNSAVAFGGSMVMLPRFEPHAALDVMAREHITFLAGVPTMYWQLLEALREHHIQAATIAERLRVATSGGAALPVEIHQRFASTFGVNILEGYGLSETSPIASYTPFGVPARPGSIGLPVAGVEMKLVDADWKEVGSPGRDAEAIGEIAIRGHNVMKGYHNRPEATAEVMHDGWFRSGDLARRDSDGWYYIVDRSKDLIVRGGYNVYPREVEEVLITHPDVSLAAVVGVPHEAYGEEVKAFVVLRAGATASGQQLIAWSRERMAAYKYPRSVEIVERFPMTATGKILKRSLGEATSSS